MTPVVPLPLGRIKFNVKEEDFEFEIKRELKEGELAKRKDSEKKEEEVWGAFDKAGFDIDKGGGGGPPKKKQEIQSTQS